MPVTGLRGRQILDGDVFRNDINITTAGSAVIRKVIAGTNISISSTGADAGTGDVTINATGLLPLSGGTLTGTLIFGNASSPNTHTIQFGDNTGWILRFMTNVSGTPTQRFSFSDSGNFVASRYIETQGPWFATTGVGASIYLNGTTGNRIEFNSNGIAAPALTTRSAGTKIVLRAEVSASLVDYALGIDSDSMWYSVAATGGNHKWYGGTTLNMHLSGQNLVVGTGAGVGSGRVTINAAAGGTSLYLTDATNSTLIISHPALGVTRFTNGASVIWLSETGGNITLGNSTSSPSRLFIYNDNIGQPTFLATTQSTLTTLQDTTPLQLTDLYNSGANGHNLVFRSTASTGSWEYNITKTFGGILTMGVASAGAITRHLYLYSSGQLRLANYTTTTSFTGTAVGVLAFTSDGSIITIATPAGGSGITGTGNQNYITKFSNAGATSIGNSLLFDNGTDIGINTATPTTTTNYTSLQVNGTSGGIVRFSYAGTNAGTFYGSSAETAINAPSQINFYVNNVQIANAQSGQFNTYETFYARKLGAQIQIAGGVGTASGIYQAATNLLIIGDWATGSNGIVIDVGNGILRTRASSANGNYIQFERSTNVSYGYVGNSSQLFLAGFNANTDLGIRSEGAMNFGIGSAAVMRLQTTGQLRLVNYTATTSFTGTAVGYLAFDSSGNIITTAAPSGSSQWTTSGVNIYYTAGGVSIGTTTISDILHIGRAAGNDTFIRFDQLTRTTWRIGQAATQDNFQIYNASAGTPRLQILPAGQLILSGYTAYNSFSTTDAQGILGFDTSGNVISLAPPIYRNIFIHGVAINATPPTNISFYNSSNAFVTKMDLTGKKRARLMGRVTSAGIGTAVLRVRYAATFTTTASSYLTMGSSEIEISLSATGHFESAWISLVAGAKADVYVALLTNGGDGADQLAVANAVLEVEE